MPDEFDVLVIGGGASGVPAAVQAARSGARTGLIEKNGALGGTTTVAGVALPGLFHAWGQQIIAGIGWDLVTAAVEVAGGTFPDFGRWDLPHYRLQVPVSAAIFAALADELVLAAGVELLLHTMIADVEDRGDHWRVLLCSKEGLHEIRARRLIDCTGDADVVAHAGLPRLSNPERQPGTLMVRLGGYQFDTLDLSALDAAYDRAVLRGDLRAEDFQSAHHPLTAFLRSRGENAIHVVGVHSGTSADRTATEVAARQVLLRIFRFLRAQPGLGALRIESWAVECGVRESFTIDGWARISLDDYRSGRLWDDAVSYSFYPIDVHSADGDGIDIRPLAHGTLPTIPRDAMIPREGPDTLLVAGRCISGDQEANSAYRVQASCMAMGQAAGALAALSCHHDSGLRAVPIDRLHQELRSAGALVPGDVIVAPARPLHPVTSPVH